MHLVTLRIDRLYDVHPDPFCSNQTRTLFSFDSASKRYLAVSVEGTPHLETGQTITAALRQANNWQTLQGMLIHETDELCVPSLAFNLWMIFFTGFVAMICFMQLKFDHPHLVMPVAVGFALVAMLFAYGAYSKVKLIRALRSRRSEAEDHNF